MSLRYLLWLRFTCSGLKSDKFKWPLWNKHNFTQQIWTKINIPLITFKDKASSLKALPYSKGTAPAPTGSSLWFLN